MDEVIKVFVGLDVHKDSIAIAVAEAGRSPGRLIGQIAHDVPKLIKALARLGEPSEMHVVYEAGATGYGLQRALSAKGYRCEVIAPSLIPKRPGDRIKTDRRDSLRLAELSRAGELRAVWIPDKGDEAIRDLSRAREDAVNARTGARQHSCRLSHATNRCLSKASATAAATTFSRSGFSVTTSTRDQLRVSPDQRRGLRWRACR